MTELIESARRVQFGVITDEADNLARGLDDYSPEAVRQAVVHTRQDVVLLASYLTGIHGQLVAVRRLLLVLVVCAIAVTLHLFLR